MRSRLLKAAPVLLAALVGASLFVYSPVAADPVTSAKGAAYGVSLTPGNLGPLPSVEAAVPPGPTAEASDSVVEVPAAPLATSFTANVQANASIESTIDALLQSTMEGQAAGLPTKWNGRGYAITEDLVALTEQLKADVIESEAVAACDNGDIVFGSAARIVNLTLGTTAIPVLNPTPNQVLLDQAGIRIVFWETNWDPDTGGTTDGTKTVFANALHVTAPGGIDLVVSHSEATAGACAAPKDLKECEDGVDNDGDGKIDFPNDPGCESPKDDDERDLKECEDGVDNDGDGKIDFPADPGCDSPKDDDETDAAEAPPATPVDAQPAFTG
ncbi:MAG: choice-of-anchor P family protein [Actinomycetota bacterium]